MILLAEWSDSSTLAPVHKNIICLSLMHAHGQTNRSHQDPCFLLLNIHHVPSFSAHQFTPPPVSVGWWRTAGHDFFLNLFYFFVTFPMDRGGDSLLSPSDTEIVDIALCIGSLTAWDEGDEISQVAIGSEEEGGGVVFVCVFCIPHILLWWSDFSFVNDWKGAFIFRVKNCIFFYRLFVNVYWPWDSWEDLWWGGE